MQNTNLQRFIDAQTPVYDTVVNELKNGKKTSHWMWYIFPQIKGLGFSSTSQFYGIADMNEAIDYLNHPVLGQHLQQCCQILLSYTDKSAEQIFGSIDTVKLKSSMTLFATAFQHIYPNANVNIFTQVLNQYFQGELDKKTLELLAD